MSKEASLKDFYNNPEVDEDDEDSEQDSDFVPDENESDADDQDLGEDEAEEEEAEEEQPKSNDNSKKRNLAEPLDNEDVTAKKSRIDTIWADMNEPKTSNKPDVSTKTPATGTETTATAAATTSTTTKNPVTESGEKKPISSATAAGGKKKKSPLVNHQKRPKSTLSSLVSQYNIKEPKMNTLEKSKLDWQGYVDREGIRDDLKYKNKDGYMEKVAFLQRVDDRRLNQLKSGQKSGKDVGK